MCVTLSLVILKFRYVLHMELYLLLLKMGFKPVLIFFFNHAPLFGSLPQSDQYLEETVNGEEQIENL